MTRLKYLGLNLRRVPQVLLSNPIETLHVGLKRLAYTFTRRFVGDTIRYRGDSMFNEVTLMNHWAIFNVRESDGPWVEHIRRCLHTPRVLDVGSNFGQFQNYLRTIRPDIEVYGADPVANADFPYAIGTEKTMTLGFSPEVHSPGVAYKSGPQIQVPCRTLDEFGAYIYDGEIDLLKVDVDGSEAAVLSSGIETLKRTKFLLIEHNEDIPAVQSLLLSLGFVPLSSVNSHDVTYERRPR